MIGISWSRYADRRVKCIHRWRRASSCSVLLSVRTASSVLAMSLLARLVRRFVQLSAVNTGSQLCESAHRAAILGRTGELGGGGRPYRRRREPRGEQHEHEREALDHEAERVA